MMVYQAQFCWASLVAWHLEQCWMKNLNHHPRRFHFPETIFSVLYWGSAYQANPKIRSNNI